MHLTVLFASPRGRESNTRALLEPFLEEWRALGHSAQAFSLFDMHVEPCRACRGCQSDWEHPACVVDRLVYAMDKYYGHRGKGPALLADKGMAVLTTCGYRPERGADLFVEGMRRWCKHSDMRYLGELAERHTGYGHPFMDGEKEAHARAFARKLAE